MKNLFSLLIALACLAVFSAHAAKSAKPAVSQQAQKERLVLMPLRIPEEDKSLQGAMETALVEGLQQKYIVFSGEQVAQKAREIFLKESRNTAKKECDETRCMQGIAEAFQAELLATANVSKQSGSYFLALSVQNIFDNKVEYSKTLTCENCTTVQMVNKLKELSGVSAQAAPVSAAPAEPEAPKVTATDPDGITWTEAQKGNAVDDYQVYLDAYPKGKYIAFAKAKIKKLNEAQQAAAEQQEQQAWDAAQQANTEAGFERYLQGYPNGKFAGFAKTQLNKLKTDLAVKEETELWNKADRSNDQAIVEGYLNKYPVGRYISQANLKLNTFKEEEAKRPMIIPVMIRIPSKNYEIGKYEITQAEWRAVTGSNPSKFKDCGDNCPVERVSWNDIQVFLQKLNAKTVSQYRLPTEDEWIFACHGGSNTEYCGSNNLDSVAWSAMNSGSKTHPVAQKQPNNYGLYDMSGNVWEWMSDCHQGDCARRAFRGGAWITPPLMSHSTNRDYGIDPANRYSYIGFRVARTLP